MHWYSWAVVLWAIVSGVPAIAALLLMLLPVVARRVFEFSRTRAEGSSVTPSPATAAQSRRVDHEARSHPALLPSTAHLENPRPSPLPSELARQAG
jgi:hypothetical protein